MGVSPAIRRLKQEEPQFEASLGYVHSEFRGSLDYTTKPRLEKT